jgi:hypothetical protein
VPRKVLTIKAAAAALVAVLSIGGVAAAASRLLPDQASPVADQAPATTGAAATATTGADAAAHGLGKAAAANLGGSANGSVKAGSAAGEGWASAVGPDATAAARAGLCRAWQAGQGADHRHRAESVAFQALVDAAGGADKVAAYCQDVVPGAHGTSQASPPSVSAPSTSVSPPTSGPPADPGPPASTGPGGHRQGGPPTTSG